MTGKNKDILTVGIAVIATATLTPMISESAKALCRVLFSRNSDDVDGYGVDIDSSDYDEYDDDYDEEEDDEDDNHTYRCRDENIGSEDESANVQNQMTPESKMWSAFEQLSPEEKTAFLRNVVSSISSEQKSKSDELIAEASDDSNDQHGIQQSEEAATAMIDEEDEIYLDRTSKYDSILEEKEFEAAAKEFPEINDILISCEEQNMSIEETRLMLRSSLRKIKIDKYQKEHPQDYRGKKRRG